jgi:hypothetical protein
MGDIVYFLVRSGRGTWIDPDGFTDVISGGWRVPRRHQGDWQSVTWKRRRYQLFGGIRTGYFICTNNPLRRRTCPKK